MEIGFVKSKSQDLNLKSKLQSSEDLIWIRKIRNLPSTKIDIAPGQCNIPWHGMQIDFRGRVFICYCDGWLPYPVGHILDFESIEEVYQSQTAKIIQQTIIDGTYEYCDTAHCQVKLTQLFDLRDIIT